MTPGSRVYSVECPNCGETFEYEDPDLVAYTFGTHLTDDHDIHPAAVRWMIDMYNKRKPMQ